MTDKNRNGLFEPDGIADTGTHLGEEDEMTSLFAAFDDVSASEELQQATLARIRAMGGADDPLAADAADMTAPADGPADDATTPPGQALSSDSVDATGGASGFRASAGGKSPQAIRRAKWRTIRAAILAACLVLALTGGVAYATPVTYYEVTQDSTTVTLGVNCFGVTVSAVSDNAEGRAIVESTELCNMRYEDSLSRAIGQMEERDPEHAIEFGPLGGQRETLQPRGDRNADGTLANGQDGPDQGGDENPGGPDPAGSDQDGRRQGAEAPDAPASPSTGSENQQQRQSAASAAPGGEGAGAPQPTGAPDGASQPANR